MPIEILLKHLIKDRISLVESYTNVISKLYMAYQNSVIRNQRNSGVMIEKKFNDEQKNFEKYITEQINIIRNDYTKKIKDEHGRLVSILAQINEDIEILKKNDPTEWLPWEHKYWDSFEFKQINKISLLRFGEISVQGLYETLRMPAFLEVLTANSSIIINILGNCLSTATDIIKSAVLHILVTNPPGKVNFTFVDPIELGTNMACFLDLPEHITGGKILTRPEDIEKSLSVILERMEVVTQKYLGHKYPNIEAYNKDSDELAEPYHFIIIEHFPEKFTEAAVRSLLDIVNNGIRTGVYTIIVRDQSKARPQGFPIEDLECKSVIINCEHNTVVWKDLELMQHQVEVDKPPISERMNKLIKIIAEESRHSNIVELPFEIAVKEIGRFWSKSCESLISAPIGRTAANKTRNFNLGNGLSQHAILVGKTSSGKSNLLHVLIVILCLSYSPDELALYLIDFKKGIEFKDYASMRLPHAKVIAIQSEREFGLSVLRELSHEMQRRGDLFRSHGVHNIREYRQKNPSEKMPRILLVVDEFQEFFSDDDAMAWECADLLDRLVRQGRAFGVHVILATQSLTGVHKISKSTIDQMTVRIALQCSDTDSRAILGDENPAAKFLSRPGEAIYNDSNGLIEGNDFFQVLLLTDENRKKYLRIVRDLCGVQSNAVNSCQIIFEGDEAALIENNLEVKNGIETSCNTKNNKTKIWLGEPIAIKPHTNCVLEKQNGANLLIVGQNELSACAMMMSAFVSLVIQTNPRNVGLHIVNLTSGESSWGQTWERIPNIFNCKVALYNRRNIPSVIECLRTILNEREASYPHINPEQKTFLLILGIHRARDLRSPDGYSFTQESEKLAYIVENGPELGLHTLCWVDSYKNIERVLGRKGCRFDLRVALQMALNESNEVIDCPMAHNLGPHRAIFYDLEKSGYLEKFRPYSFPTDNWLEQTGLLLRGQNRTWE